MVTKTGGPNYDVSGSKTKIKTTCDLFLGVRTGLTFVAPFSLTLNDDEEGATLYELMIAVGIAHLLRFAMSFRTEGAIAKYAEFDLLEFP